MEAHGAYLKLLHEVLTIAEGLGIFEPAERLWTYVEQERLFSHLGVELCAVSAKDGFRSGCWQRDGFVALVFNANLPRSLQLAEIYRRLLEHLAVRLYPAECARDPEWAACAARSAVRHWLRNLRILSHAADLEIQADMAAQYEDLSDISLILE